MLCNPSLLALFEQIPLLESLLSFCLSPNLPFFQTQLGALNLNLDLDVRMYLCMYVYDVCVCVCISIFLDADLLWSNLTLFSDSLVFSLHKTLFSVKNYWFLFVCFLPKHIFFFLLYDLDRFFSIM